MPNADTTLTANYQTAIDQRYASLGGAASFLGAPTGPEVSTGTGRTRTYTGGRLYWSPSTGVHEVHGAILARYLSFGGLTGWLGFPTSDELPVPGGRESDFQHGRIYWSAATRAHEVHGGILQRYLALRGPSGYGLPVTDETSTPDRVGRYNHFTGGRSIYWTPATGAHAVYGAIRSKWAALAGNEVAWATRPPMNSASPVVAKATSSTAGSDGMRRPGLSPSTTLNRQMDVALRASRPRFLGREAEPRTTPPRGYPTDGDYSMRSRGTRLAVGDDGTRAVSYGKVPVSAATAGRPATLSAARRTGTPPSGRPGRRRDRARAAARPDPDKPTS